MNEPSAILRAASRELDLEKALEEINRKNDCKNEAFTILFFAPRFSPKDLEQLIPKCLGPRCVGCSTAGEIGPDGYLDHSVAAITFKNSDFSCRPILCESLASAHRDFNEKVVRLKADMAADRLKMGPEAKSLVISLIDGLSMREEELLGQVATQLGDLPVTGGSAGDELNFNSTTIYNNGKASSNRALFIGITTTVPFRVFMTQHFAEKSGKVVITQSQPDRRVVEEIDGMPAAEAYALALGVNVSEFSPRLFSENPIMLKIDDNFYVRSIQKANPDGSLTFYCAIDDGLVLSLAQRKDLNQVTEEAFASVAKELGEIDAVLGFECILRKLEVDGMPPAERARVQSLFKKYNIIGFHTYGEQFGAIHVNQTFSGVAFGRRVRKTS